MRPKFKFRLYVAGGTPNSAQAIANLTALCKQRQLERSKIEVVDVLREPKRGLADGILMTPTLLKLAPAPIRRIIGTLTDELIVLDALGLDHFTA